MSFLQVTAFRPRMNVTKQSNAFLGPSVRSVAPDNTPSRYQLCTPVCSFGGKKCPIFMRRYVRQRTGASRYQLCTPVCSFGGKGKSEKGNEASPWKSMEKAMGSLKKEQSLEDVLRQQMEKQEYYDDGGSGGKPPGGGGGGGSGGLGGTEDEGFQGIWDEIQQVTMATLAFIFLYAYIIAGDDIKTFVKDCHDYFFRGGKNEQIRKLLSDFGWMYRELTRKRHHDPYWLEKAILSTTTWWDSPAKCRRVFAKEFAQIADDLGITAAMEAEAAAAAEAKARKAAAAATDEDDFENGYNDEEYFNKMYKDDDGGGAKARATANKSRYDSDDDYY